MTGLFPSVRAAARRPLGVRTRLQVEVLEDRTCLSAPQLAFSIASAGGRMVTISGQVTDEHPAGSTVTLGGVVSGTATPNASGYFSMLREASALGLVTGSVLDDEGLSASGIPQFVLGSSPSIQDLSITYGAPGTVTLAGRVVDNSPGGLQVNFTGAASGSATTNSTGLFSVTLTDADPGSVQAQVFNVWGLSTVAMSMIANQPPVITSFTASRQTGNIWCFQGTVQDEDPDSCVVRFGGIPSLEGRSVGVDENGWFCFTIVLAPGEDGIATAQATDAFGLQSEIEETLVAPT